MPATKNPMRKAAARSAPAEAGEDGKRQGVAAVERALSILGAFYDGESTLSLSKIAQRAGLYKSTTLRLID
jgi:hypothetical protein